MHTDIVMYTGPKNSLSTLYNKKAMWAHSPCYKRQGNARQNTPWCPTPGDPEDTGSSPDQDYCYSDTQKTQETYLKLGLKVCCGAVFTLLQLVTLTEKPSFLNSLAQSERLRSLLRPLSLSVSNAACRSPWSMSLCS